MWLVILCIRLLLSPVLRLMIIIRVIGVGLISGLSFTSPTPLANFPKLSPALSIRAGSGLGPRRGQVVRLAACLHQPLLIVGQVQPILILLLIGSRGLRP